MIIVTLPFQLQQFTVHQKAIASFIIEGKVSFENVVHWGVNIKGVLCCYGLDFLGLKLQSFDILIYATLEF